MDWSNERYVRVYTRDTVDLSLMHWQSRNALWELMRKVDRAGVIDLGAHDPARGLASIMRMPEDVVADCLKDWLADGCVEMVEHEGRQWLLIPNFIAAQECQQSNAERCRRAREKRRDTARRDALTGSTTDVGSDAKRVDMTQNASGTTQNASQPTQVESTRHSVPSVPSQPCCAVPAQQPRDGQDPRVVPLVDLLTASAAATDLECATPDVAERLLGVADAAGRPMDHVLRSVGQALAEADMAHGSSDRWTGDRLRRVLRSFVEARQRRPEPEPDPDPPAPGTPFTAVRRLRTGEVITDG